MTDLTEAKRLVEARGHSLQDMHALERRVAFNLPILIAAHEAALREIEALREGWKPLAEFGEMVPVLAFHREKGWVACQRLGNEWRSIFGGQIVPTEGALAMKLPDFPALVLFEDRL